MSVLVADLGNSRLKWAAIGPDCQPGLVCALPPDDPDAWARAWDGQGLDALGPTTWAVSSVNPPAADRLARFLADRGIGQVAWFRAASAVPVAHRLDRPEATGADRALAVLAAGSRFPRRGPGLVVLCGTALTVERIAADGVWDGGAIAPGLGTSAEALHRLTAQLPRIILPDQPSPPAFGRSTLPAMEAGVFWGVVGAARELIDRQARDLAGAPWLAWSGGDAARLAPWIDWPHEAIVAPDLVLQGLALAVRAASP